MLLIILQFLFFAAIIVGAGVVLSRSADRIAEATGIGRLLIGSVLLASATSLPELSVDISCVRQGEPDLAIGDLLGSSLMNLLILAVLDLTQHSRGKMLSRTASAHALSGAVSISLTAIVAISLMVGRQLGAHTVLGIGIGSWLVLVAYGLGIRMIFLDQRIAARTVGERPAPPEKTPETASLWPAVAWFAVAAVVVFLTGPRLSAAAAELAELTGLARTFVGTTLVAISTSLPELVTCWAAVQIGSLDLAIGDILGSNAFNMIIVFPLDALQPGSLLAQVSPAHAVSALAAILATSVILMGQLYQVERRLWLIEPDALLVILIVASSLGVIYLLPG